MKPLLFDIGLAAGLLIIPLVVVEIINALAPDEPLEPLEDDGWLTLHPKV